jgi:endo-1,4-beta-D-glucanase Y
MKHKLLWLIFPLVIGIGLRVKAQINTPSGAVVPFGSNSSYAGATLPTNLPTGGQYGRSQDAADAYNEWKNNYVVLCNTNPKRYRVKFDEPNRTVSEGIAYGMLLAAYAADKDLFDGLWNYYKFNSNSRGFMHWRIDGCSGVSGQNGAADADVDAAYALLIAENQWPNINVPYDYISEANTLLNNIVTYELHPTSNQLINGDGWGFANDCRNPGYQSPAYFRQFAITNSSNASRWNSAVSAAYTLINNNADATTGLVSDWSNPQGVRNTCNSGGLGYAATDGYGYDACRNPWRMAHDVIWNGTTTASSAVAILNKIATYVNSRGVNNVGGPLYQNGTNYPGYAVNATFVSTFAMAVFASSTASQSLKNAMYTRTVQVKDPIQNFTFSGYFGNTLRVLSLFMQTGNFWKYGTTSLQEINVRVNTQDVLSGTTYDFQNQQTIPPATSGKVVTFTIENLGFATLNLTGSPRVSLTGPNANQFVLNASSVPASLGHNQSATFTLEFRPTSTGVKTATITIANNDPDEGTYSFTVIGNGTPNATAPIISIYRNDVLVPVGGNVAMGTTAQNSPNTVKFDIKNTGDAPLNITSITVSGTAYQLVNTTTPFSVPIGGTGVFYVRVLSSTTGNITGSVTVNHNDVSKAAYLINLSANVVACGTAITQNEVFQDFDANYTNTSLAYPQTAWTENVANPSVDVTNPSLNVARFIRPNTGTYVGVRYVLCGTSNFVNLTSSKYIISVLVYSPAPGIPVLMNLKTDADVANTTTYPSRSSVTVNTTKSNQWERLYFNHSSAIGVSGIRHIELFIDPINPVSRTYYVDDIRLDVDPCIAKIPATGILNDFEDNRNVSLPFAPPGTYNDVFANPHPTGLNTSSTVAQYVRPATGTYQIIRYAACNNQLQITAEKPIISMLIYSPNAGVPVLMSLKDAVTGTNINELGAVTVATKTSNQWERLYFDFSNLIGNTSIRAFDIFIDPNAAFVSNTASRTYLIDDIKYESQLPCVTGIPSTGIFNDFDSNRFVELAFNPVGTYNQFATNPNPTGQNTSSGVASYVRPASTTPDVIRYVACGNNFSFTPGRSVFSLQILASYAQAEVILSFKAANGTTEVAQAFARTGAANTWTTLNFDFTSIIGNTSARFLDIIIDPNAKQIGNTTARTYYIDNIRYSTQPEIAIVRGTLNINSGDTLKFGNVAVGDSVTINLTLRNNGGSDLQLNGTPVIKLLGADAVNYAVRLNTTFSTIVPSGSATGFSIVFKPISAFRKLSAIEIANTDLDENPFYINLDGIGIAPEINIVQGTTNIPSGSGSYSFGNVNVGTSTTAVTFTIQNIGNGLLNLTGNPRVSISGAHASDFTINQSSTSATVAAGGTTTFSITFTPQASGNRSATISISNNDSDENPYVFTINGVGDAPTILVQPKIDFIKISPNPVKDLLNLEIGQLGDYLVQLFDVRGYEVYHSTKYTNSIILDMSSYPSGQYILKISNDKIVRIKKIIKD